MSERISLSDEESERLLDMFMLDEDPGMLLDMSIMHYKEATMRRREENRRKFEKFCYKRQL